MHSYTGCQYIIVIVAEVVDSYHSLDHLARTLMPASAAAPFLPAAAEEAEFVAVDAVAQAAHGFRALELAVARLMKKKCSARNLEFLAL